MEPTSGVRAVATGSVARYALLGSCASAATLACFLRFGPGLRALVGAAFLTVLVVLSAVDLEERRLPNRIVLPAGGAALLAQTIGFPNRAPEWVLASLGAAFALLLLVLVNPGGLGLGDVKLALLLGAVLGKAVILALVLAFLSVFPVALYLLVRHGTRARKAAIPFGPFLAVGAAIALFASSS